MLAPSTRIRICLYPQTFYCRFLGYAPFIQIRWVVDRQHVQFSRKRYEYARNAYSACAVTNDGPAMSLPPCVGCETVSFFILKANLLNFTENSIIRKFQKFPLWRAFSVRLFAEYARTVRITATKYCICGYKQIRIRADGTLHKPNPKPW